MQGTPSQLLITLYSKRKMCYNAPTKAGNAFDNIVKSNSSIYHGCISDFLEGTVCQKDERRIESFGENTEKIING